ncbi:hypothetical protein ES702_02867 [subsurface metagenome]
MEYTRREPWSFFQIDTYDAMTAPAFVVFGLFLKLGVTSLDFGSSL